MTLGKHIKVCLILSQQEQFLNSLQSINMAHAPYDPLDLLQTNSKQIVRILEKMYLCAVCCAWVEESWESLEGWGNHKRRIRKFSTQENMLTSRLLTKATSFQLLILYTISRKLAVHQFPEKNNVIIPRNISNYTWRTVNGWRRNRSRRNTLQRIRLTRN